MQLLIFNIYNEYCFDEVDDDDIYEQYYVQSLYYKKDVIENEFLSEMETAILLANGDNINTSIETSGNTHYVDIFLLHHGVLDYNPEHVYNEPNPNYIKKLEDWLEKNLFKANDHDVKEIFQPMEDYGEGYFVRISIAESLNFAQPILQDFQEVDIDYHIVTTNRLTYNAGSGGFGEGIVIWIASKCADLAFDKLKKHFFEDRVKKVDSSAGLDKLLEYLERYHHVSRIHLNLKGSNTFDNGDKEFTYSTYYQDFTITCDYEYEVRNVKTTDRTTTYDHHV